MRSVKAVFLLVLLAYCRHGDTKRNGDAKAGAASPVCPFPPDPDLPLAKRAVFTCECYSPPIDGTEEALGATAGLQTWGDARCVGAEFCTRIGERESSGSRRSKTCKSKAEPLPCANASGDQRDVCLGERPLGR